VLFIQRKPRWDRNPYFGFFNPAGDFYPGFWCKIFSMGRTLKPGAGRFARAVSAELRAVMARRRISGNQLSKDVGMSQNYIAKRLRDDLPFDLNDLSIITSYLGISLPSLVENVERQMREEEARKNAQNHEKPPSRKDAEAR
jgi:hypothetical protein